MGQLLEWVELSLSSFFMAGSSKKRVRKLRESGQHDMADWVEEREKARALGAVLWEWERDNPKPGTDPKGDRIDAVKKSLDNTAESVKKVKCKLIPDSEQVILDKIRENKGKLKDRAKRLAASGSIDELKTLYKVIKRLDNEEKKIVYEYDFAAFDRDFFNDIQDRVDTADFHFEMIDMYNRSKRSCVVCPRGHAKSTTARKYLLHQLLYNKTRYIIIVGASEDMAAQNLRWIRDQLTDNDLVIDVFGYLKNKDKWADTEFQTNGGIKVTAKGAGQKIRGANEKGRPDLIYIDDLEEDEQVSSKDRREKLRRWFIQALMPAKSRSGRIIITGTILHLDSLIKKISENKVKDHLDWDCLWYQAIMLDKNNKETALWEEHKPLDELRKLREADPETFAQEYQNNPVSGAMAVFSREEYKYISDVDVVKDKAEGRVYVKGRPVNLVLITDLALSEKEGSDYTVFMMTGMDDKSNLYVLEYERFRSSDPYEQIDMIFEMSSRWGSDWVTMEQVAFQKTFKRLFEYEMSKRDTYLYIHEISRQSIRKIFRIKSLKGPIRAGKLYWHRHHVELEEELLQVTVTSLGTHDDVIDCLADGWEVQVELTEDFADKRSDINTLDWAIEEGLFKTVAEQEEEMYINY